MIKRYYETKKARLFKDICFVLLFNDCPYTLQAWMNEYLNVCELLDNLPQGRNE